MARTITAIPLILALVAAGLAACVNDDVEQSGADEVGVGDGDGDSTSGAELAPGDCQVWELTYDLDGSEFEISGTPLELGDQVNVVGEPYNAADRIGPGTFVLRFHDVGGAPGGRAFMVSHEISLYFEVDAPGATVTTTLEGRAGPDSCGLTSGVLSGTTVTWAPPAIVGYHSRGQVLCEGAFCRQADLPRGEPVLIDEVSDQPISDFVFNDDLTRFSMAKTVIEQGEKSVTSWMYEGVEISRERIDAPACLCGE